MALELHYTIAMLIYLLFKQEQSRKQPLRYKEGNRSRQTISTTSKNPHAN